MQENVNEQSPKVLKFLNDYRKQLSKLKTKSFYAYHLCKKNCLQSKLNRDPTICFQRCDQWLDKFFTYKKQKNPDQDQIVLFSSQVIPDDKKRQYQINAIKFKMQIKDYLTQLDSFINEKIGQLK